MRRWGVGGLMLLAALAQLACGVESDHGSCRAACDKKAACLPSMGDKGWQSCLSQCRDEGRGPDYAICVNAYDCDDAFENNIALYCDEDPAHPPRSAN